jgi:hypothetical protein
LAVFTLVHVVISLVAIAAGFVVMGGMLSGKHLPFCTAVFLVTTIATNATGFGFPFVRFLPAHGIAIVSLVLLAVAVYALYVRKLAGKWKTIYVATALASLYFNVLVLVVQTFLKFPVIQSLAPNQNEPPFVVTQGVIAVVFVAVAIAANRKYVVAVSD